ncbi:transcription factor HES-1 isoform X1 [Chrysemys picta bellii]|uniref:transcription factor HES-1 isoform X1 n=1 Tax=Chrysemys picta bellii TaxID=8478 RepID=UPI0032B258D8
MPADMMEKNSSPVAATPASVSATPDKPKTASEHRKSSKPIMEKRRRARINESLSQLKTLILDALKKDVSGAVPRGAGRVRGAPARLAGSSHVSLPAELAALQAGEGRYPGDDREASPEPAARPDDGCSQHGPHGAGQVPGRLQRVHERGDPLPLHLRGGEHRGAHPSPRSPGQLHDPDQRHELPGAATATAPTRGSTRLLRAAAGADPRRGSTPRRRSGVAQRDALQVGEPGRGGHQGVRWLPAGAWLGRPVRLSHPQHLRAWRGRGAIVSQRRAGLWGPRRRAFAHSGLCVAALVSGTLDCPGQRTD